MIDFEQGVDERNNPWIKGVVPLGNGESVYVDTRTGTGIQKILDSMEKFIHFKSKNLSFPGAEPADLYQDIILLMISAIPYYSPNKECGMKTFLQKHVSNRLVNKCKFHAQDCRRASLLATKEVKARCPHCNKFTRFEGKGAYTCGSCGYSGAQGWRVYTMPVLAIPFSSLKTSNKEDSDSEFSIDDIGEVASEVLLGKASFEVSIHKMMDNKRFLSTMSKIDQQIIEGLSQGLTRPELAQSLSMTEKDISERIKKLKR